MSDQKHNPKYVEAQKRGKVDYSVVPWQAIWGMVQAMMEGAGKYGRFNFLQDEIEARTYIAAISRHLFGDPSTGSLGWVNGEDIDEESGLHHLDKVMACCLLVRAAERHNKLIDNRLYTESKEPPSTRVDEEAPPPFDIPSPPEGWPFFEAPPLTTLEKLIEDVGKTNAEIEARNRFSKIVGPGADKGHYVEFHDNHDPSLDVGFITVLGPFESRAEALTVAQENKSGYAGQRTVFEIR